MDASPESSVISGFFGLKGLSQAKYFRPSFEGLVVQIVATKLDKETVC